MQRPQVVSSTSSSSGTPKSTQLKVNAAAFQPSSHNMLLHKEEKKDDNSNNNMVVMKSEDGDKASRQQSAEDGSSPTCVTKQNDTSSPTNNDTAPAANTTSTTDVEGGDYWNPLEHVDSALLSALCDQRERKAMVTLEQVMIDFMRNEKVETMEVGGAFNSIVFSGSSASSDMRGQWRQWLRSNQSRHS